MRFDVAAIEATRGTLPLPDAAQPWEQMKLAACAQHDEELAHRGILHRLERQCLGRQDEVQRVGRQLLHQMSPLLSVRPGAAGEEDHVARRHRRRAQRKGAAAPVPERLASRLPQVGDDDLTKWTPLIGNFVADVCGAPHGRYPTSLDGWRTQVVFDAIRAGGHGWAGVPAAAPDEQVLVEAADPAATTMGDRSA